MLGKVCQDENDISRVQPTVRSVYLTVIGAQKACRTARQLPRPEDLQWPQPIFKLLYPLIGNFEVQ